MPVHRRTPKWDTFKHYAPNSVPKGDKAQDPVEAAQLLPHSGRRGGTRTALHCPSDTHNQGTELAMKVVRQARLELSGGSTPDLLRPQGSLCPATVSRTASAGFNGICNRQLPPPTALATSSNRLSNRCWGRPGGPLPSNASLGLCIGDGWTGEGTGSSVVHCPTAPTPSTDGTAAAVVAVVAPNSSGSSEKRRQFPRGVVRPSH